ncbi:MAG: hypothetical protein Q7R81_05015 [Candidatus Peregrinibacteria bacterium]|nr:hypothetical protein [Candidatus Peregrinibacteria bacterium]
MFLFLLLCGSARAAEEIKKEEPAESVKIGVENAIFPLKLDCSVVTGKDKDGKPVTRGVVLASGRGMLPPGEAEITLRPVGYKKGNQDHFIWAIWIVNDKVVTAGMNQMKRRLEKGDRVRVWALQPVPPWNGAMVRYRGKWMLVILGLPKASANLEEYEKGTYKSADMPNGAVALAKHGPKGLAKELAEAFVRDRGGSGRNGKYGGRLHSAMIIQTDYDGCPAPFDEAKLEDLIPVLEEGFRLIAEQRPPLGDSIASEVETAKDWLAKNAPKTPEEKKTEKKK